jgi:imidazolonepropionase-like amidohydrolase
MLPAVAPRRRIVAVHELSALDHSGNALQRRHVLQRIAVDRDEIGTRDHWPAEYLKKNRDTTDLQREGFAKAVKLGVPLTFGTDAGVYPHGYNARQFSYMVRYGMTPMQALAAATSEAAKALGRDDLGSVTPGHAADFVAVDRDPLQDVTALQCVAGVIQGGKLVNRDDAAARCDRWKHP